MPTSSKCYKELYGHDFPYPGSRCMNCGVDQAELSGATPAKVVPALDNPFSRQIVILRPPAQGLHTELQALVAETRRQFGETASKGKGSFGFYIGFFRRLGVERVRMFLAETKDGDNPKILFWWKVGQYFKELRKVKRSKESYPQ